MKKIILLLVLVLVVAIGLLRQRLFLRDPLANVTRDGVREDGAQIYINYSNDALVRNDTSPAYTLIVQHGQHVGTPQQLHCSLRMACLTDANPATLSEQMNVLVTGMSGKLVEFTDPAGHDVKVKLR